jgi:predicted TIM-barrel fold metal-dependent hydrolase
VLGQVTEAAKLAKEGLRYARESRHLYSLGHALTIKPKTHYYVREPEIARAHAEVAIALSEEHGFAEWIPWGATFEDDRAGVLTRDMIGVENLMWGSDYPHTEGVWPYSRKKVAQNFANIPEGDTRKMVHDNVARVFGFPMN